MIVRLALSLSALLCFALAPAAGWAQETAPAPEPATVRVTLQTSEGAIVLALEKARAPLTTANFLRYVDEKRLDGTSFYRAAKVDEGYGLIQGGTRNDPKRILPPVTHEPTTRTGLSHTDGTISMARDAPGTASGDFFLIVGDMTSLDADPAQPGDNAGFAAFGHVVEGMDVVRKILDAPTSPTEGEGVMKGQMLAPPIRIVTARRAE
ncbi:MAG TPA: peptidylprolyl isomerase [Sphingomonadaceae bacterium]|nr:peptidylprolyl isomerase [Sphingomonadaceae bacterium]